MVRPKRGIPEKLKSMVDWLASKLQLFQAVVSHRGISAVRGSRSVTNGAHALTVVLMERRRSNYVNLQSTFLVKL